MGPSHRVTYREFEGTTESSLPVRQVIAFAPRKDGEIFDVTAGRLGRSRGVALDELEHLPTVQPAVGSGKEAGRPVVPPRMALPPDLAQAMRALEGQPPPTSTPPTTTNHPPAAQRRTPTPGPSREK
ncbi:hypothetical protein GCM10009742_11250 [Kribbella karoonensis]|uniref:Uncharacterized protein n=1 Tax=Kribbella karoonensis TaxID=324851 RepID=A0ABN2D8V1_9ACTN